VPRIGVRQRSKSMPSRPVGDDIMTPNKTGTNINQPGAWLNDVLFILIDVVWLWYAGSSGAKAKFDELNHNMYASTTDAAKNDPTRCCECGKSGAQHKCISCGHTVHNWVMKCSVLNREEKQVCKKCVAAANAGDEMQDNGGHNDDDGGNNDNDGDAFGNDQQPDAAQHDNDDQRDDDDGGAQHGASGNASAVTTLTYVRKRDRGPPLVSDGLSQLNMYNSMTARSDERGDEKILGY